MGNLFSVSIQTEDTVSHCWDCIAIQTSYTRELQKNLKALNRELEDLQAQRDDVKGKVDHAERRRMEVLRRVRLWLSRVQTTEGEAQELIGHGDQQVQKLCCAGCFSMNCKSSYNFGKQVTRILTEIVHLKNEGDFETVAENDVVGQVDVRPFELTVGLEPTLDEVWRLLQDNNEGVIGLYGLGGVGKTTILTQINNKLSTDLLGYDVVTWAVASKDHEIEQIQEKIGKKIGLSLDETWKDKSCEEKAIDIWRFFSQKKFVLLLDDVWEWVDLIKVGIPQPNQKTYSKLIFTTRSLDVCAQMEAHKSIKVECLCEDEAWKLFKMKVGEETLDCHPDIRELAKQVVAECEGLPLALITIGRAMACKKMPQDWKNAIEKLKESPHELASMDEKVYKHLKYSFDSLPEDTMRSCLLYCSLYPEDFAIPISVLIDNWCCEKFMDRYNNISSARRQGQDIISYLLDACLLERYERTIYSKSCIKMHDVIRDMTLWIAQECEPPEKKFFVKAGQQLRVYNFPSCDGVRMSLASCGIKDLRGKPICPNLQTLLLNDNKLVQISDGFFRSMLNLRVLNLAGNKDLRMLPEGISEIVSLEYLSLRRTAISTLPIQLNRLLKLKYLDLNLMLNLCQIPRQLVCKFSKLQIFKFTWSINFDQALIEELKSLQHLNVLCIEIKTHFALESLLSCDTLRGCTEQLYVQFDNETRALNVLSLANMERLEVLYLMGCRGIELGEGRMIETSSLFPTNSNTIISHFNALSTIYIARCGVCDLTWLIFAPNLIHLQVLGCPILEEVISETTNMVGISNASPFAKLEKLTLYDLPKLKSIYWGALSFPCLRRVAISKCPNLHKLMLHVDSPNGKQISIEWDEKWWEQVQWEDEHTRNALLPSSKHRAYPF